jgi:hypothetical protein
MPSFLNISASDTVMMFTPSKLVSRGCTHPTSSNTSDHFPITVVKGDSDGPLLDELREDFWNRSGGLLALLQASS